MAAINTSLKLTVLRPPSGPMTNVSPAIGSFCQRRRSKD
jgi:hypothetical protein